MRTTRGELGRLAARTGLAAAMCLLAHPASASIPCQCGGTPTVIQIDVWIDPGHDSVNTGNNGLNDDPAPPNEQDVTWTIANNLIPILANSGYCALLTRTHFDTVYAPRQRAGIASGLCMNDNGDHAFGQGLVSVHTNSDVAHSSTFGTMTVYPHVKSCGAHADQFLGDQSFAADLQAAMAPQMAAAYTGCGGIPCNSNRGICPSGADCSPGTKTAIEEATIPAVIVEVGYQTNACQECAMRLQPGVIANAVAAGISNTFITPTFCASASRSTSTARRPNPISNPAIASASEQTPQPRASLRPTRTDQAISFSEGFEGGTFPPTGWAIQTSGVPSAFAWARTSSSYYVGSGTAAAFIGGGHSSAKDEWLISPAISLGVGDTGLQFSWVGNRNFSSEVDVQLLARPSSGGTWTTLWSLSSEPYGNAFAVKPVVVSLGAFAGQSIQTAFRAVGQKGADFSVDDVAIGGFQLSQPPSNDQCASAAQLPSGSFSLAGATCTAANDMDPSNGTSSACIGYEMDGPDVFYHFSAGVGDTLTASVHALWGPGLYVMRSCSGAPSDCMAGRYYEDSDSDPSVNIVFTQAGQYILAVDAPAGSCGDFQLSGMLYGPTTGVESESEVGLGLQIAPNPMVSRAAIAGAFRQAIDGQARLTITDVQGRRVLRRDLTLTRGRVSWEWNRRNTYGNRVPPGIYLVELKHGEQALRSRVVVRN